MKNQPAGARTEAVDAYVQRLKNVVLDRAQFEAGMADLAADKAARKIEVLNIASGYLGIDVKPRARAVALELIRKKFVALVRFDKT